MSTAYRFADLFAFTGWDLLLIVAVTVQATALAYLRHPRWKALLLTLPIPFSMATLSLGVPVDATNVVGLLLLLGYTYGVYYLHTQARAPIVVSIVLCAAGYCLAGTLLATRLPHSDSGFWVATGVVFVTGLLLYRQMPSREEPAYRSPLPVALKAALIALVIVFLVVIKRELQGFMTVFPMVSVVACYEGRHCLWTLTRQIPVLIVTLMPLMVTLHLLQPVTGMACALAVGWVVFLAILIPFTRRQWAGRPVTD